METEYVCTFCGKRAMGDVPVNTHPSYLMCGSDDNIMEPIDESLVSSYYEHVAYCFRGAYYLTNNVRVEVPN